MKNNKKKYIRIVLENNYNRCTNASNKNLYGIFAFLEDFYYRNDFNELKRKINQNSGWDSGGNITNICIANNLVEISPNYLETIPEELIFKTDLANFNRIVDEYHAFYQQTPRPYEVIIYRDESQNDKITLVGIYKKPLEMIHTQYIRISLENTVTKWIIAKNNTLLMLFLFFEEYYLFDANKIKDMINKKIDWCSPNKHLVIHFENDIITISFSSTYGTAQMPSYPINKNTIFKTDIADFKRIVDEFYTLYAQNPHPYELLIYIDESHNNKITLVGIYE